MFCSTIMNFVYACIELYTVNQCIENILSHITITYFNSPIMFCTYRIFLSYFPCSSGSWLLTAWKKHLNCAVVGNIVSCSAINLSSSSIWPSISFKPAWCMFYNLFECNVVYFACPCHQREYWIISTKQIMEYLTCLSILDYTCKIIYSAFKQDKLIFNDLQISAELMYCSFKSNISQYFIDVPLS